MTNRKWIFRAAGLLLAIAVVIYFVNPLGVPSLDPRGRIAGMIPYTVTTESMTPAFPNGTSVVACTSDRARTHPEAGDVVVFRAPGMGDAILIQRVVGVAGDTVGVVAGNIEVNGVASAWATGEVGETANAPPIELVVPEAHVYVAGDNPGRSRDSRYFGPLPTRAIVGRVCWRP